MDLSIFAAKTMVRHIVMFKFKNEGADKLNHINIFKDKLDSLKNKIREIKSFNSGINLSESPNAFDLVLESDFESAEDLEKYKIHADHQELLVLLKKLVKEVHVVDYSY